MQWHVAVPVLLAWVLTASSWCLLWHRATLARGAPSSDDRVLYDALHSLPSAPTNLAQAVNVVAWNRSVSLFTAAVRATWA